MLSKTSTPSGPSAANRPTTAPILLTPKQAARHLNLSESWLAKRRVNGDGPPYVKLVVESYKTTYRHKRKCNRSSGVERTSFNTATTCDEFYFSGNKPQTIPKLDGRERSAGSLHPLPDGNGPDHGKEQKREI